MILGRGVLESEKCSSVLHQHRSRLAKSTVLHDGSDTSNPAVARPEPSEQVVSAAGVHNGDISYDRECIRLETVREQCTNRMSDTPEHQGKLLRTIRQLSLLVALI